MPRLSVAGFEGPLDFLLEMVRRHRVDLGPLSIVALTDQLVAALEDSAPRVPLARRSTWLVAASDLVLLKARLLCPESPAVAEAAAAEATRRLGQLAELARMRAAADWLAAGPQLGLRVFARGQMERQARPQAELYVAFLEATLAMLEGKAGQPAQAPAYQPAPLELWRVPEAIEHITRLLSHQPDGLPLADCLPPIPSGMAQRQLRHRAALASTLVASLELARDATLEMDQDKDFGTITLRARTDHRIGQESAA
ncbi:segregation and condensation protein A [Paeniroseomonas aquatica]